mgnify:CR=1 FL=1
MALPMSGGVPPPPPPLGMGVGVGVGVQVAVGVRLGVLVGEAVGVAVAVGVGVALGIADGVGDGVAVSVAVAVGLGVSVTVGAGVGTLPQTSPARPVATTSTSGDSSRGPGTHLAPSVEPPSPSRRTSTISPPKTTKLATAKSAIKATQCSGLSRCTVHARLPPGVLAQVPPQPARRTANACRQPAAQRPPRKSAT